MSDAREAVRTQLLLSIEPESDLFFGASSHRRALEALALAFERGERVVMLTGEPGTGKTTVLQRLMDALVASGSRAIVHRLPVGVAELQASLSEVGAADPVAVGLDEAQAVTDPVLESLPALLAERPGLRIVLAGEPDLVERLAGLGTRVPVPLSARAELGPLTAAEVGPYIEHWWRRTSTSPHPFSAAVVRRIARVSAGIPQVINVICDRALHLAAGGGRTAVSRRLVDRVAREVALDRRSGPRSAFAHWLGQRRQWRGAAVAAIVAIPLMIAAVALLQPQLPRAGRDGSVETARPSTVVSTETPAAAPAVPAPAVPVAPTPAVAPPTTASPPATSPTPPITPSAPLASPPPTRPSPPPAAKSPAVGSTPPGARPTPTRPRPAAPRPALASAPVRPGDKARERSRPTAVTSSTGQQSTSAAQRVAMSARPPQPAIGASARGASRDRPLLERAEDGDLAGVRRLLAEGASPDARDPAGVTPLMLAAIRGDSAMIEVLTARGASVNAQNRVGLTPLMLAAINNRATALRALLAHGANVNMRTRAGWTALTYAAWRGHPEIVRVLLARGADPRVADRGRWTVLDYASWRAAQPPDAEDLPGFEPVRGDASRRAEVIRLLKHSTDPHVRPAARRTASR